MPSNGSVVRHWTRREMLTSMGAAAVSLSFARAGATMLPTSPAASAKDVAFPKGSVIRTLLKDVSPASLGWGPVLFHEHLSLNLPGLDEHFTDDVPLVVEEVKAAGKDGISCIVDAGHADMGRRMQALERIARESKVPIIASGGYYLQRTYPQEVLQHSVNDITDMLVRQADAERWGALGEMGQEGGELSADERKVFQAVAKVQAFTGLPLFTHNAYFGARSANTVPREAALRQLDVLESAGAKPDHVAIGHVCCLDDRKAEIPIQLARRGAFVGFDRVTIPIVSDEQKAATIMAMVEAGYANKVLISSDFYSHLSLRKNGGAGVGQAITVMKPMLLKAGMSEEMLHGILVDNPRCFLAFVPRRLPASVPKKT